MGFVVVNPAQGRFTARIVWDKGGYFLPRGFIRWFWVKPLFPVNICLIKLANISKFQAKGACLPRVSVCIGTGQIRGSIARYRGIVYRGMLL